jgi:hypothetical protein
VTAAAGKPPLTVSNNVMNPKLDAQFLGGFAANGLGRVALASNENFTGRFAFSPLLTVSITAPAKGFVRLEGRVGVFDGSAASYCTDCEVAVQLRDVSAGTTSPRSLTVAGAGTHSTYVEIPTTWVFPVTSGAHSYSLDTDQVDFGGGPFALHNPVQGRATGLDANPRPVILAPQLPGGVIMQIRITKSRAALAALFVLAGSDSAACSPHWLEPPWPRARRRLRRRKPCSAGLSSLPGFDSTRLHSEE